MTSGTDKTDGYNSWLKLQWCKDSATRAYPQIVIPPQKVVQIRKCVTGFPSATDITADENCLGFVHQFLKRQQLQNQNLETCAVPTVPTIKKRGTNPNFILVNM